MEIIKKYKLFLERLEMSLSFRDIVIKLENKVSIFLQKLQPIYKDDEYINFVSSSDKNNMISFLATNRRIKGDWEANMTSYKRQPMRIGSAVRQIYESSKKFLEIKINDSANIVTNYYNKNIHCIDFENSHNFIFFTKEELELIGENKEVELKLKISGVYYDCKFLYYQDKLQNGKRSAILIYCENFINCPKVKITDKDGNEMKAAWSLPKPEKVSPIVWFLNDRLSSKFILNVEAQLTSNIEITDSNIERFTNEYISYIKSNSSDETSKIEEIKGEQIRYWYNQNNYQNPKLGKLGDSCMKYEDCSKYFDIYVKNPDKISLLILRNKEGKLVGRALVFKLDDGDIFMDRIYTANDADDNIFINYAITLGYIYRNTSNKLIKYFKNKREIPEKKLTVTLKNYDFNTYPFMDTFRFLTKNVLSNKFDIPKPGAGIIYKTKSLMREDGGWDEVPI